MYTKRQLLHTEGFAAVSQSYGTQGRYRTGYLHLPQIQGGLLTPMIEKLEFLASRFSELERDISSPDAMKDMKHYKELMQERSHLSEIVEAYGKYRKLSNEIKDARELISSEKDSEMRDLAREELKELEERYSDLSAELKSLLIPKDPLADKNIIVEIRAGTGWDEAALFASDLFRMYSRFAESKRWSLEVMSENSMELGASRK